MNPDLLLSEASFLMSHDAATGYLPNNHGVSGATNLYAKNQIGTIYQQLDDGARALDVRPKLLQNGTVLCHHGAITIPVTLNTVIADVVQWAADNPDELVLILHINVIYESGMTASANTVVNALSQIYNSLDVAYVACDDVYGLTVEDTMELAQLSSGGYVLALDRQDAYASSCAKLNYISDQIVTCYPTAAADDANNQTASLPCTDPNSPVIDDLKAYVLASANNNATDSSYELGPPASLDYYPLNTIQALWQVDTHAATIGVAHVSSLIDDNTKSQLNAQLVEWIYYGEFSTISLFMIDHVQLNGNAILSVLRNTCGQSDNTDACGTALSKPKVHQKHMSTLLFAMMWSIYTAFIIYVLCMIRHYRKYYNHDQQVMRMRQDLKIVDEQFQKVMAGEFT